MPEIVRRFAPSAVAVLSNDECDITICTSDLALDNNVWVMSGVDLTRFQQHPVVLWMHDLRVPVGRVSDVKVTADKITGRVTFPPAGASPKADEVRALVKSGFITGVSAGITPLQSEPLDQARPRNGRRITKAILLECSFCSVPSDTASGVTARSTGDEPMADWTVGAARNLPIEDSDNWDGGAAEQSIFEWAGGDSFDPKKARDGFLVYDADAPDKRGSYKLPIARVKDGKLVVPKGAIRAAASRLPQTDVPDDVKKRAESVLNSYRKKAKIADDPASARASLYQRMFAPVRKRGLYEVACLCWSLLNLDGAAHAAKFEAALEGDGSAVPAMLAAVVEELAVALKAMTAEEIDELLAAHDDGEGADYAVDESDRAFLTDAANHLVRSFRRVMLSLRAGRALSKSNTDKLESADGHHTRALKHHRALGSSHSAAGDQLEKARAAHRSATSALKEAKASPSEEGIDRCMRALRTVGEHLTAASDEHADMGDSHRALGRSIRSAQACVRSVLGQSVEGDDANPETPVNDDDASERASRAKLFAYKAKAQRYLSEAA